MRSKARRVISMNVLPGEPLDGSGRVCIHLFVRDEEGLFTEPHVMHQVDHKIECRPARGRLACDPKRNPATVTKGSVTTVTPRTDDPRAVTCPKCLSSRECTELLNQYESAEAARR